MYTRGVLMRRVSGVHPTCFSSFLCHCLSSSVALQRWREPHIDHKFYTVCAHTLTVLWYGTIRPNGNAFYERPLLWMCESDRETWQMQHPAKCQCHGGHKCLSAHCCDTLGSLCFASCHSRPAQKTWWGDILILIRSVDRWPLCPAILCSVVCAVVDTQQRACLSALPHTLLHSTSPPAGVRPETLNCSPVAFSSWIAESERVCECVFVCLCVKRGGSCWDGLINKQRPEVGVRVTNDVAHCICWLM